MQMFTKSLSVAQTNGKTRHRRFQKVNYCIVTVGVFSKSFLWGLVKFRFHLFQFCCYLNFLGPSRASFPYYVVFLIFSWPNCPSKSIDVFFWFNWWVCRDPPNAVSVCWYPAILWMTESVCVDVVCQDWYESKVSRYLQTFCFSNKNDWLISVHAFVESVSSWKLLS